MYKFVIHGGKKLSGKVEISGAKNASLALMPAALLASGSFKIDNTPDLRDVATMAQLMETLGAKTTLEGKVQTIETSGVNKFEAPYELVKKMRASIYVLGPLLGRYGYAKVSMPGGCAWGPRPINLHLEGMEKLGAEVTLDSGYIVARAKKLTGAKIHLDVSSVGATVNIYDGRRPCKRNYSYYKFSAGTRSYCAWRVSNKDGRKNRGTGRHDSHD